VKDAPLPVLTVCGFGRCGSSLVMQMLAAGGIATTGDYPAFEDDRMNFTAFDLRWLAEQRGRAVKILDPHKVPEFKSVPHIAIWIDRDPREQAKSHAKFVAAVMGIDVSREHRKAIANSFRQERREAMLCASADPARLYRTTFEQIVEAPAAVLTVLIPWLAAFGFHLDFDAARAVVRRRSRKCLPYMLEAMLIEGGVNARAQQGAA